MTATSGTTRSRSTITNAFYSKRILLDRLYGWWVDFGNPVFNQASGGLDASGMGDVFALPALERRCARGMFCAALHRGHVAACIPRGGTARAGADRHAIAKATTQPMSVQSRNRLITITDPTFRTWRATAMMVGKK
jgi:hypothetical protein